MEGFKFRAMIDGPEPMSADTDPFDAQGRRWALMEAGRVLVIETVRHQTYADTRWHDAMAAEGLPSEFPLRPSRDGYFDDHHVVDEGFETAD